MDTFAIKSAVSSRDHGDDLLFDGTVMSVEELADESRVSFLWLLCVSALILVSLMGCSSGGGGGAVSAATQGAVTASPGSVQIAGRIKPASTGLIEGVATPDDISMMVDEVAISTDGNSYETVVAGQLFDSAASPNSIIGSKKTDMVAGSYDALRLSVSNIAWNANWTFSNPSPCDNSATGSGSGSFDLNQSPMTLYFKTADLGGNSALFYQSNPPLSGYVGDADHPLMLPAPVQVLSNETTTVSLVMDTENTLGCSHVSVFGRTDGGADPNVMPQQEIVGSATRLFGASGLIVDVKKSDFVITNAFNSSLTTYPINGGMDPSPTSSIAGPGTRLNGPSAIACYRATGVADDSCDEYVALNRSNNSIITYSATATDNATPLRSISGPFTGLSSPSGIALNLYSDPNRSIDPSSFESRDEILVANSGNDSITSYTRVGDNDTYPLRTLQGTLTGLDGVCGVAIDKPHHEVFVTNSISNTITMYDLYDLDGSINIIDPSDSSVISSPHLNIQPLLTITSNPAFSSPCGIVVDSDHGEMFVANKSGDSIVVLDLAAVPTPEDLSISPATGPLELTPARSIAGANTGLHQPQAMQVVSVSGGQLWVVHDGGDAVMSQAPRIIPVVSTSGATANSVLSGDYNVVKFGIDIHKGVNGVGIEIPVIHAERGKASFDPQAANGPSFTYQRDSITRQFQRQLFEAGCGQPDHDLKQGIFGVASGNKFYAFDQNDRGMMDGSFLANGDGFAGVDIDGDEMAVIYGLKSTGSNIAYTSENGSDTGDPAFYAYINYSNSFLGTDPDIFKSTLGVGYVYAATQNFLARFSNNVIDTVVNPMSDAALNQGPKSSNSSLIGSSGNSSSTLHVGGMLENVGYGMAGAVSREGQSFVSINDTSYLDSDLCQITGGVGVGMRQAAAGTYKTNDIKGTYFISGIGDAFQSKKQRNKYFSWVGTINFDGLGSATMVQTKNSEGDISSKSSTFAYQVVEGYLPTNKTPNAQPPRIVTDVLSLYSSSSASTPYMSALIGMQGRMLTFYGTGASNLMGIGLLQNP